MQDTADNLPEVTAHPNRHERRTAAKSERTTQQPLPSSDLIWTAGRIAQFLNITERAAFDLLERGKLPGKKVGGRWCASASKLLAAIDTG